MLMNLQPIFLSPVVSKPPSITCRHAAPSASEHALYAFLRKRHENYLRKLSNRTEGEKGISAPVPWDLPDTDLAEHVVCHARRRLLKRSHRLKAVSLLASRQQANDSSNFKLVKTCHLQKSQGKASLLNEHTHVHLKMVPTCTSDAGNKKENTKHKRVQKESSTARLPHEPLAEVKEKTITMDVIESVNKLRKQQRDEIYALNGVMTEYEEENFRTFLSAKV